MGETEIADIAAREMLKQGRGRIAHLQNVK